MYPFEKYASIGAIVLMLLSASCASDRPSEREALNKFPQVQPPSLLAHRLRPNEVDKEPEDTPTALKTASAPQEARVVEVTGLQVQGQGPAGAIILVTADGALADYESFALPDPPRLVIDIPRARHAIPQPVTLPVGSPILKVRTTQYRERPVPVVRLVFDLGQALPYRLELTGNQMQILVSEEASKDAPSVLESKQTEAVKEDKSAEAPKPSEPATVAPMPSSAQEERAQSAEPLAPAADMEAAKKEEAKPAAEDVTSAAQRAAPEPSESLTQSIPGEQAETVEARSQIAEKADQEPAAVSQQIAAPQEARVVEVTGLQVQGQG
ncbi:MAG TPA: AMIN domain-containing protein, partial [Candidatus Methylomirabilis sp.]|nr:AMIN domain-containing protein [Candidatus Methylomirabilis sp.]